jgi:hypothetical protein
MGATVSCPAINGVARAKSRETKRTVKHFIMMHITLYGSMVSEVGLQV